MHIHQFVQQIFSAPDTVPDWDIQVHLVGNLARYKRQHPRMKLAFLLSKARFSHYSRKNTSRADSRTLCAFWQRVVNPEALSAIL